MIDRFLTFFYMPGEETLFHGIRKLPADIAWYIKDGHVRTKQYWDLEYLGFGPQLSSARLSQLLEEVVASHMISDVPVGFS